MYDDIELKIKRKNKLLFSRNSKCLEELIQLIQKQNHRTLVLWAFECVKIPLEIFKKQYPKELRPRLAFDMCKKWASGEIKMPIAKRAILDCHSVAKEIEDDYYIALCHAIGQGLSTIHVKTHAIGLPIYELTAIVLKNKPNYKEEVENKIKYYIDTLLYFQNNIENIEYKWAKFLLANAKNKEKLLWEKRNIS